MNKAIQYFLPTTEVLKKEFREYFQSYLGWVILFLAAALNGLLSWWTIHQGEASDRTLQLIFYRLSGTTMVAGALIGMKLFAEERALGTLELLFTAPVLESQMILGKFFSALLFLLIMMSASFPIPLIISLYGDPHIGQILSGYVGIFFIGAACIAIATFYSTLTNVQLLAGLMGIANIVIMLLLGFFSPYVSEPMKSILREFSLYVQYRDFEKGVLVLRHVIFFLSVIAFYLYLATVSLKSRRWS